MTTQRAMGQGVAGAQYAMTQYRSATGFDALAGTASLLFEVGKVVADEARVSPGVEEKNSPTPSGSKSGRKRTRWLRWRSASRRPGRAPTTPGHPGGGLVPRSAGPGLRRRPGRRRCPMTN